MPALNKTAISLVFTLSAFTLNACSETQVENDKNSNSSDQTQVLHKEPSKYWPPLSQALSCLSKTGPIISQHRGRSKKDKHSENSLSALKSLRRNEYIMAEIDVARLKDGTHILFHDGVWDEHSTGKGPIAATDWNYAQTLLLINHKNKVQSDRPLSLDAFLNWADGQIYFEIDFKSSANEKEVISKLKSAKMDQHVILISYNKSQAIRLSKLSKSSLISAPVRSLDDIKYYKSRGLDANRLVAWLGTKELNTKLAGQLKSQNIQTAYGMLSPRYSRINYFGDLNIIVTDYPNEAKEKAGSFLSDKARLDACKTR